MTTDALRSTPYLHAGFVALAHRGFAPTGLENSLAAFEAARDLGYRYVETDAHATSDGVAVALHDASLDRTTDGHGLVARQPWRTVRRARIGGREPVPALEDLLGAWPDLRVNVDVKSSAAVAPVAEVIERTRAHDRVCVASFSAARRRATVARLSRPVATSAAQPEVAAVLIAARTGAPLRRRRVGVDCLQVPERVGRMRVVDRRFVRTAHAAGLAVHVWTVNAVEDMERLIDLGVDGIVTDRADMLRDVLARRGRWRAPRP
ncbi:glycerophosphodiester phosphodiesterase family protein [Cellulosimicrobium sp. Marseille-Q4280]|uniref:glycerophosphodiester phosphodiesterase family protein n=1 Tax=Cellulosimicrobium sp. Marseille-Q4280 TaxID=2937992 RepID=UPI00203A90BA|nr:glycerophosphodiester phosphodiesterase family protein [Cellulosimicrobium sp. Marseille-Q4280]